MSYSLIVQDSFVSDGADKNILLPSSADYFVTRNITQLATTQNPGRCVQGEWLSGNVFSANDGIRWKKTDSSSAINMDLFSTSTASNGFTYVTAPPAPGPAVTGTAITAASPAVVSSTNTFQEGDDVVLYGTTGMSQIAGMRFTVSSVSGSGYTLLGLDASAFAAPATALVARKVAKDPLVAPSSLFVTKVTQAAQAVVTVSQVHKYVAGQKIRLSIPQSFGMTEANGLTVKIVSVTAYTMTVDLDSSGFTAFAFPASSASPTAPLFATLAPAGQSTQYDPNTGVQTGYNFTYAPFHSGIFVPYMVVSGGAQSPGGSASDVIVWSAYKKAN